MLPPLPDVWDSPEQQRAYIADRSESAEERELVDQVGEDDDEDAEESDE